MPSLPASSDRPVGRSRSSAGRAPCVPLPKTCCSASAARGRLPVTRWSSPRVMDSRPGAGDANPVARFHEHVLQERQGELFPPGASVLDVGSDAREGRWDAGFATCEAAARLGPVEVGRRLSAALPAGAPVLVAFPGAHPLPALLARVLRGAGGEGEPEAKHLGARDLRRALGPGLEWRRAFALGVLLPGR